MRTIKDIPLDERPYERCLKLGVKSLTDAELLAIILRSGTKDVSSVELAAMLINNHPQKGLKSIMHSTYEEYRKIKGIGKVKAIQLLCIGELSHRIWKQETLDNLEIFNSPKVCAGYYMQEMRHLKQEELRIAFLDTRQRLISDSVITVGTVNSALISVREILIAALKNNAVNIIMLHNHPSGNPTPSEDDINVTNLVNKGCRYVGINLNDHIIIGDNKYYSFKEQGVL